MRKAIVFTLALVLFACAGAEYKKHEMALQLVVRAATGRVLTEKPDWAKPCYEITANALKIIDQGKWVTVAQIEEYIVSQINWDKLAPEEKDLLRYTIAVVRQEVENYLTEQQIKDPGQTALRVAAVLTWINQTAEIRI